MAQMADRRKSRPETTMKISARNQLKGKIVAVKAGATTSHVSTDIGQGSIITASISLTARLPRLIAHIRAAHLSDGQQSRQRRRDDAHRVASEQEACSAPKRQ